MVAVIYEGKFVWEALGALPDFILTKFLSIFYQQARKSQRANMQYIHKPIQIKSQPKIDLKRTVYREVSMAEGAHKDGAVPGENLS